MNKTERVLEQAFEICIHYQALCDTDQQLSNGTISALVRELSELPGIDTTPLERAVERPGNYNNTSLHGELSEYMNHLMQNPPNLYNRATSAVMSTATRAMDRLGVYLAEQLDKVA